MFNWLYTAIVHSSSWRLSNFDHPPNESGSDTPNVVSNPDPEGAGGPESLGAGDDDADGTVEVAGEPDGRWLSDGVGVGIVVAEDDDEGDWAGVDEGALEELAAVVLTGGGSTVVVGEHPASTTVTMIAAGTALASGCGSNR